MKLLRFLKTFQRSARSKLKITLGSPYWLAIPAASICAYIRWGKWFAMYVSFWLRSLKQTRSKRAAGVIPLSSGFKSAGVQPMKPA